ncbi:MAG: NADH-quinone oxidoreductase subunit A [Acidimicrobiia bacterium]|nr:NADH-quinone oxidoreductase subunit A [Acidimicrobiia bacterium]
MAQYLPILTMVVLVILFVLLSFVASIFLGVKRPTKAKTAPYECGIVPEQEPVERFPVKFYLVALTFIILDVEIIFLYPFATVFRQFGGYGIALMGVFLLVLIVPFAYLLSVGALDWGPVRQVASRIVRPVLRAAGMPDGVADAPERAPIEAPEHEAA